MEQKLKATVENIGNQLAEIYNSWPELQSLVFKHDRRIDEHERRLEKVEHKVQRYEGLIPTPPRGMRRVSDTSIPPPVSGQAVAREFGFKQSDTGSYKIPSPDVLEQVASRFRQMEDEKRAIQSYIDMWKRRILFFLAVSGPFFTLIGWALEHFVFSRK